MAGVTHANFKMRIAKLRISELVKISYVVSQLSGNSPYLPLLSKVSNTSNISYWLHKDMLLLYYEINSEEIISMCTYIKIFEVLIWSEVRKTTHTPQIGIEGRAL
jgi:hypothetical protein